MFEDATMESSGRLATRSRYYTIYGALFNGALLAGMILVPLLRPEALPKSAMFAALVAPPPPPPPPPAAAQPAPARSLPQPSIANELDTPPRIPAAIHTGADPTQPPPAADSGFAQTGTAASLPAGILEGQGSGSRPVALAPSPRKVIVSQGVMAGNIVSKAQPAYPAIARAARIEGTVVLSAVISRDGRIERLAVVSGQAMLAQAALDAVRSWRYQPYELNGEPVEVQTTINVTFKLGG